MNEEAEFRVLEPSLRRGAWASGRAGYRRKAVQMLVGQIRFRQERSQFPRFRHFVFFQPGLQMLFAIGALELVFVFGFFDLAANSVPQVRAGTIKGLAVTLPTRIASAPEIPTVDEASLRGFHFVNWHAIWAPRGTPAAVTARLNAAVRKVLTDPLVLKRLADIGQEIPSPERQTAQALATYQTEEIARWWPVIRAADIRAE